MRFRDGDRRHVRLENLYYSYRYDPTPIDELPDTMKTVATMSAELAREIAACPDRAIDVAQRFGVTVGVVNTIRNGKIWREAAEGNQLPSYWKRTNTKLTKDSVWDILASPDGRAIDLTAKYEISSSVNSTIRQGNDWQRMSCDRVTETSIQHRQR